MRSESAGGLAAREAEAAAAGRPTRVFRVEHEGVVYDVYERSQWDKVHQRIDATYVHVPRGSGETLTGTIPQRYLLSEQVPELLARGGLELVVMHGDFDQCVFDEDAEHLIVTARRAQTGL